MARRGSRSSAGCGRMPARAAPRRSSTTIARSLKAADPDNFKDIVGARVETIPEAAIGGIGRRLFLIIMAVVIFVLLIAGANVANLLLLRSAARAREMALRTAMGATRWRLVRQLLLESIVLSLAGAALGVVLAQGAVQAFAAAMQNGGLPFWVVFSIDYVVVAYAAAIAVVTAMVFGLAPALHVSRANSNDVIKDGGRGSVGAPRVRRFGTVDGGPGIVGGHRAARRRRFAGAQLRRAVCDRSRREHRSAGDDEHGPAGVDVSHCRRSARVRRDARAASRRDSRRAVCDHHDRRALARRRRALSRGRGDAERRATRHGVHRHHHTVVLRHHRRAPAAGPRVRGRRWRAGIRNRDHQPAARRAVLPRTESDRPAPALHATTTGAGRHAGCLAHHRRRRAGCESRIAIGQLRQCRRLSAVP